MFSHDPPVHENLYNSSPDALNMPDEGPASPDGSMDDPSEMFSEDAPVERENESISPPASPADSLHSLGLEVERQGSDHGNDRSPVGDLEDQDISPPASPSPESPAELENVSPAAVRSRSVTPVEDDAGEQDKSVGEEHRSQSGSPARTSTHVVTPVRSQSGSRSPSTTPAEIRSRSPSVSGSSRSGSPAGTGAGAGSRSPSIRSRSRSGSPAGAGAGAGSRSPSIRSRSRSGSPGGRSMSPGGRIGSHGGSRSRSVSPALSRSPSQSPVRSRSPSVSSTHGINQATASPAQAVAGYLIIVLYIHCVQKKTPTHIFFHIFMSDV